MAKIFQNTFFKNHSAFIGLMLIGFLFRILFIEYQGLSNDELSAWYRTRYSDWNSFWNLAVKTGDMHPVFYQAFLNFWVRIFGDSEWALRSTGLLFYLLNSWLIYQVSSRFFSKKTGLGIIAIYTCLAFTIINTTFARPYNSGTFFLLLVFWSILEINKTEKKITGWHLGIILGFLGAMTSHYFAFLTAGLIGVLGIIYLKPKRKKDLIICGTIAVLCFLPHWPVTNHQLNVGGLGWLPAPKLNWLLEFLSTFFNNSWILAVTCILAIWMFVFKTESKSTSREEKFAVSIFIITYLAAHLLSVLYTPILRDLVMLFLLPFLFLFLFRKFGEIPTKKFRLIIFIFPVIIGFHSIISGHLLQPKNFGIFKEIGGKITEFDKKIERKKITFASNYNHVDYLNYYLPHPLSESITDWSSSETAYQLAERAKNSKNDYFTYSWSNAFHIPMYYEVIQKYYPKTIGQESYFNSAYRIYQKQGKRKLSAIKGLLPPSKKIRSSDEFVGEFRISIKDLLPLIEPDQYLLLKTKGKLSSDSPIYFVVTAERDGLTLMNGKDAVLYQAFDQSRLNETGKMTDFFIAFDLVKDLLPTDKLKFYFWNPEKQEIEVDKSRLYFVRK